MKMSDGTRIEMVDLTCRSRPYDTHLLEALRAAGLDARLWISGCSVCDDVDVRADRAPAVLDLARRLPEGRLQRSGKAAEYLINLLILLARIRRERPPILHLQWLPLLELTPLPEIGLLRRARRLGIGTVYTVHNVLPHGTGDRHRKAFRRAYHTADALICHTEDARRELVDDFGVAEEKVWRIPHGPLLTDIDELSRSDCRSELGLDEDRLQVLLFGVLRPYKGIDFLLRAWSRLEGEVPDARLVIAGSGETEFLERVDEQIRELRLEDHVETHYGFLPDETLKSLIQASDILVYPYERVTQSGALLAGMAAGKAIIATALAGFRETLRDGETALLVESGDETGLASSLERLLKDNQLRRRLGDAVGKDVRERFSWDQIAERTMACYRSLLPLT